MIVATGETRGETQVFPTASHAGRRFRRRSTPSTPPGTKLVEKLRCEPGHINRPRAVPALVREGACVNVHVCLCDF